MKIQFGITFGQAARFLSASQARGYMDLARRAEDYGFQRLGTYDTAFTGDDAFMRTTLLALASERALVGLRPTNPLTREPQVMASFLASIDALTHGRAFMDIASGDSSVLNIGLRPATRAHLEEYVDCVRALLRTGEATYRGRPQRVRWAGETERTQVPISICAGGPKMLHLGGRIADGVVAGTGLSPEVVADTRERVRAGALSAGRQAGCVELWFVARARLDLDRQVAVESAKVSVSSILHHSMRGSLDGKFVPAELRDRVCEYVAGYVLLDHVISGGRNPERMEELGLSDFALDRWAIAGNVDDWIARIGQLADAGVRRIWLGFGPDGLDRLQERLRLLGEHVLPNFAG
jgi:5,10-methylenetetrahydromethanopterin reductase